jgi:hypothetical protein
VNDLSGVVGEILLPDSPQDAHAGTYAAMRAAVDVQISTAKRYPRNLGTVGQALGRHVTMDEQTAQSCIYSIKRGGKTIRGPSIRFAEILAYAWGHMRIDARIVDEGKDFIVVRGEAHDLQTNNVWAQDVSRRIVDGGGRRFDVDLIQVTTMAATSIAQRDCVLKAIPAFVWRAAFDECVRHIAGNVTMLADRRIKAIGQFSLVGVSPEMIFRKLGVAGINDVTGEHLVDLIGTFQAIRDGQTTVEAEFGDTRITSRSLGGSPLAAAEDTSAEPVAETQAPSGAGEARPASDSKAVPVEVGEQDQEPAAPPPQRAKPGPKPKAAAAVQERGLDVRATDQRLDAYERECVAAKTPDDLRAVARRWGATGYFEEMTESQKTRFEDIFDASLRTLELQAKHREGEQARQAYEAARNGAGEDSARPAPKQPEAPKPSQRPPQANNGAVAFSPEIEALRPTDPEAVPVWEECVRFLLAGENNADVAKRMTEINTQERFRQLPETDQLQMRNVAFKIRKTKPF